jgi:hypothetical protein
VDYLKFLNWIISNGPKFKRLLALIEEAIGLFTPSDAGILQFNEEARPESLMAVTPEEEALEIQALAVLNPSEGGAEAFGDGTFLRKLFANIGPLLQMLPTLIALFPKK